MMPGEGAVMKHSAKFAAFVPARALQPRDFQFNRRRVQIMQLGLRLGSILHPAALRETLHQERDQLREFLEIAPAPALRFAREARHALRHVSLEPDALLLAVIGDVDARRGLLVDHAVHREIHLARKLVFVDRFAVFAPDKKLGQGLIARQTADVGGENPVAAEDHVYALKCLLSVRL